MSSIKPAVMAGIIAALGRDIRLSPEEIGTSIEAIIANYRGRKWFQQFCPTHAQTRKQWKRIAGAAERLTVLINEDMGALWSGLCAAPLMTCTSAEKFKNPFGQFEPDDLLPVENAITALDELRRVATLVERGMSMGRWHNVINRGVADPAMRGLIYELGCLFVAATGKKPRWSRDPVRDVYGGQFLKFCRAVLDTGKNAPSDGAIYQRWLEVKPYVDARQIKSRAATLGTDPEAA